MKQLKKKKKLVYLKLWFGLELKVLIHCKQLNYFLSLKIQVGFYKEVLKLVFQMKSLISVWK